MTCPQCGRNIPDFSERCTACGAPLSGVAASTEPRSAVPPWAPVSPPDEAPTGPATPPTLHEPPLAPGQVLGSRYRIIRMIGAGGMGVVYHAWDDTLGIAVALKVLRPEPAADAGSTERERQLKRELLLARQITHKNVIRIHDMGEVGGIPYITMPYVQGVDLATVLRREGKVAVPRALRIARQIVAGLVAAHDAGVVHRDLKPANIMIEDDRVLIMDFGIARSITGATTSKTGTVAGTIEYMAPEQAAGVAVDHRADIYSFGLMLYDMLVGQRRVSPGDNPLTDLLRRMREPPVPPRSLDPDVPEAVEQVVMRCLQPDPASRFQTTAELATALGALDAGGHSVRLVTRGRPVSRVAAALVAFALAAAASAWWLVRSTERTVVPSAREPVSVLIADFENRTGDPVFGEALEQALMIGVEGAPFVTSYGRLNAQRLASQNQLGTRLNETTARLVARREGINVVLAGSIQPEGAGYDIAVRVIDAAADSVLASASASAASKPDVLEAVTDVARQVRKELGDTSLEGRKIAAGETFTAATLDAVRSYAVAQDLAASGKHAEAVELFRKAVEEDPNFGRAYSGWATSAFRLGRRDEAERLWEKALSLMDRMTEREKYRTLGTYYLGVARNYEKAIENYETLLKLYPADRVAANNLAVAYFHTLDFTKAQEAGRRALAIYPENLTVRYNLALYAMYAGDFDSAVAEAQQVLKRDANLSKAYLALAVAALARGDAASARDAYGRMARTGPAGASLANIGLADLAMYEGFFADAVGTLEKGIDEDAKGGNTAGLAAKYLALGEAHLALDRPKAAVVAVEQALKLMPQEWVIVPAARILMESGREGEATKLAAELSKQVQPQSRAYAKLIEGRLALRDRRLVDALEAFGAARRLADLWLVRFNQGIAYVEAGRHAEGLADLELCLKRRGEATAVFLDDVPSFRYLVPLSYWLARAQEGVGMRANAVQNYKAYLVLRAGAPYDLLVADARKRSNALE